MLREKFEQKKEIINVFSAYIISVLIREISSKWLKSDYSSFFMYIFLAIYVLLVLKFEKTSFISAYLEPLDLLYASTLFGLMPRYFSIMILGLTHRLVIGLPQIGILPLLIISSIIEEMFFRAYAYNCLKKLVGYKKSYTITILLYALFHVPLASLPNSAMVIPIYLLSGILFQEMYLKWGLASAIISHIAYNIIGVLYLVEYSLSSILIISLAFITTIYLIKFLA